jgi:hypothetical protein
MIVAENNERGGGLMDGMQMLMIVEQYCRKLASTFEEIKVTRIADRKTMFVEQSGESGRAVMLTEYKVDGIPCWAGYSSRSQTVYISMAA